MAPGVLAPPTPAATDTLVWTGNGADVKEDDSTGWLDEINCSDSDPNTMQWNFIPRIGTLTNIELTIQGSPDSPFSPVSHTGGVYKFVTPYISGQELIDLFEDGDVVVTFGGTTGNNPGLTISHGCPEIPIPEFPTIALPVAAILGLMFIFGRKRDL